MQKIFDIAAAGVYIYSLTVLYMERDICCLFFIVFLSGIFITKYLKLKNQEKTLCIKYKNKLEEKFTKQNNNFIEILTHDIKIPTLAQLQGIRILKSKNEKDNSEKELLSYIEDSCLYILDMISMLISTYHLETKKHKLTYEKFNLTDVINECFRELSDAAGEKHLTFVLSQENSNSFIEADRDDIKKVIKNLLCNAVKYSFTGGKINIKIKYSKSSLKFSVSGMDLNGYAACDFLSEKTVSAPIYTTIGQNISMYLTKKIIEFHRGKIYTTTGKNTNDTCTFVIPRYAKNTV